MSACEKKYPVKKEHRQTFHCPMRGSGQESKPGLKGQLPRPYDWYYHIYHLYHVIRFSKKTKMLY
jgi:hypothetical protein